MDKKFYIAANWKMNASLAFIDEYFASFESESKNSNEMIICPPDIYVQSVKEKAPCFVNCCYVFCYCFLVSSIFSMTLITLLTKYQSSILSLHRSAGKVWSTEGYAPIDPNRHSM